jgi:hypothetical protein
MHQIRRRAQGVPLPADSSRGAPETLALEAPHEPCVIVTVPFIILVLQRYIISGLPAGALRG